MGEASRQIETKEEKNGSEIRIILSAPPELLGRLIGRNGQVAKAFKNFLAIQGRGRQAFHLDIKDKNS